ncbi:unnamed protein product [Mytilus coruscus]|uniref:Uncharacterized protein n=1 Tax=Mytilus coruscus TaxID=42192 RepID=A0A6J8EN76_MYTCO|nr:unnamed protein product [Mytilus coruscus]
MEHRGQEIDTRNVEFTLMKDDRIADKKSPGKTQVVTMIRQAVLSEQYLDWLVQVVTLNGTTYDYWTFRCEANSNMVNFFVDTWQPQMLKSFGEVKAALVVGSPVRFVVNLTLCKTVNKEVEVIGGDIRDFDISVEDGATVINSTWQHVRVIDELQYFEAVIHLHDNNRIDIIPSQFPYNGTNDNDLFMNYAHVVCYLNTTNTKGSFTYFVV